MLGNHLERREQGCALLLPKVPESLRTRFGDGPPRLIVVPRTR
jgi:hypothetical protein